MPPLGIWADRYPMRAPLGNYPTHMCPKCGEWFDVKKLSAQGWGVMNHTDGTLWAEAAVTPICPYDTSALEPWLISDKELSRP